MIITNINLSDKDLFGNEAGEDEEIEILNSYYIEHEDLKDFNDIDVRLSVVSARKGMGKSSLLSRLDYLLRTSDQYKDPIVVRVTGNTLLGMGDFKDKDQAYLENYWKQIICKKIIIEIGAAIGFAFTSDEMSMVEIAELEGMKSKNFVGGLLSRLKWKAGHSSLDVTASLPNNLQDLLSSYQEKKKDSVIWLLVDDIDAKYVDSPEYQTRIASFFSAIRSLAFDMKNLNVRATVRTDVWANLRHFEDLDKWDQYIVEINWTKRELRDMLATRILAYLQRKHPETPESRLKVTRDYTRIFAMAFSTKIRWGDSDDASIFDAIYSFSNKRPRWMGQLSRMAAEQCKKHVYAKRISLDHIREILEKYGLRRKNDLIKEHSHQFKELDALIDSFRANSKQYKYGELHTLFSDNFIRERQSSEIPVIDGRKYINTEDLGAFAYKIGLISQMSDDGRTYVHFGDDPDLFRSLKNRSGDIIWSVHPAYRAFLKIQ